MKNIEENNKLIAEFMAVDRSSQLPEGSLHFEHLPISYLTPEHMSRGYYGHWNTDWNLLMPVVEKIANLTYHDGNFSGQHYYSKFLFDTDQLYGKMYAEGDIISHFGKDSDASLTKEKIYNRVVEFIKWYNKQQ